MTIIADFATNLGVALPIERSMFFGVSEAVTQDPVAVDTPLRIEFGAAQLTVNDPVMMDNTGLVTINESGKYYFDIRLLFGRTGAAGVVNCYFNILVNGVVDLPSTFIKIVTSNDFYPIKDRIGLELLEGDTVSFEITRDSSGVNAGGLKSFTPTLVRPSAPTASLEVSRYYR